MKKKLNLLLSYLCKYAGYKDNKTAASFLITIFKDNKFFKLSEKQQIEILNNLISFFDNMIITINSYQKKIYLSENDIKKHIANKLKCLCNYPAPLY